MKLHNYNGYESRLAAAIKAAVLITMILLIADLAKPSLLSGAPSEASPPAASAQSSAPSDYFPSRFGPPDDPTGGTGPMPPTF